MPNSLLTGVSGLIAHQRMLDVVGHNIANMNTTAYKSQRILFADLLYETINPATGGSDGSHGGTNPNQIGGGVKAAITDRRFGQGSLDNTGGTYDFAISGQGFFTLTDGDEDVYTRAGAFTLDGQGYLVSPGGLHLKRYSSAGEPDGINPGFQVAGDPRIRIPIGASVEGVISSNVKVVGNLNSVADAAANQLYESVRTLTVGGANAAGTALLNSLDTVTTPYADGDIIVIEGMKGDGSEQVFDPFVVTSTTTLQDLIDAISSQFPSATAQISQGKIVVEGNEPGVSLLRVSISNDPANVGGGIPSEDLELSLTREGVNAGGTATLVTVYDVQGGAHELTLKFEKKDDDAWTMRAVMDENEGQLTDAIIENIMFNDKGLFVGSASPTITMLVDGIAIPQTLTFDFGAPSSVSKLSHFSSDSSINAEADGSPPGVLTGVRVNSNGEISGAASNGKVFTLAQFAIAGFANPKGLIATGDNLYKMSLNSGQPNIGEAGTGQRGTITGGQLEASNVDVATEFTKLIVAQAGYSANARTITVSADLLEELTNLIR